MMLELVTVGTKSASVFPMAAFGLAVVAQRVG